MISNKSIRDRGKNFFPAHFPELLKKQRAQEPLVQRGLKVGPQRAMPYHSDRRGNTLRSYSLAGSPRGSWGPPAGDRRHSAVPQRPAPSLGHTHTRCRGFQGMTSKSQPVVRALESGRAWVGSQWVGAGLSGSLWGSEGEAHARKEQGSPQVPQ